jgi:hypothetical protein
MQQADGLAAAQAGQQGNWQKTPIKEVVRTPSGTYQCQIKSMYGKRER